jgi:hypothetical protein
MSPIFLFPILAFALAPDRLPSLDEWGYRPAEGAAVQVNPPSFSWVGEKDAAAYQLQWATRADFSDAATARDIPWSVYTHYEPLKAGRYYWRYRITGKNGEVSAWSRKRSFLVPANAAVLPRPTMAQMRRRMGSGHPRLYVSPADLAALREWAKGGGRATYDRLLEQAGLVARRKPTPEPAHKGSARDPETVKYWRPNRLQAEKASQEAEAVSFVYWLTGDEKYRAAARDRIVQLAGWDPDGATNWKLNDVAAMSVFHGLARGYDWGYGALSEADRVQVRSVMRRRGEDAWKSVQIEQGSGHLDKPFNSHGNRAFHYLGELAISTLDEIPDSEKWLNYAVDKFFAAYPVWSDDDGGWHEGGGYWSSYMSWVLPWMELLPQALGIDGFKKPYFAHACDYLLYTAPPGSPNMGFGDYSFHQPSKELAVVRDFARAMRNPYWEWWADQWKIAPDDPDIVLAFVDSRTPRTQPKAPSDLPASKVFRGTGVAILNSDLLSSADNVQIRFKSSPFGRQSHGHDPHNSFTLNAYGEALLVNNVYEDDLYSGPFHMQWCSSTKAQNALLVNGEGQKARSADPMGRITGSDFQDGLEYVVGDAAAAYEGKLKRFLRHVIFIKPDVVAIVDEVQAAKPSTFQWMLHGFAPFEIKEGTPQLHLERPNAGVLVDYVSEEPLAFRQWDGYQPPPRPSRQPIRNQWHVEASTKQPAESAFVVTVLRPYRKGQVPAGTVRREGKTVRIGADITVTLLDAGSFAVVKKAGREWTLQRF